MNYRYLALVGLVIAGVFTSPGASATEKVEPYPLEYWALRSVINNAQVSPDGNYLGIMKIPNKDGNPIIEVYKTDNLDEEPFRLNADPMEITSFYWASDNDIIFTLRQKVRDQIEGFNQGVYETRLAIADVESKKMRSFEEINPAIEDLLPGKPNKVLISFNEGGTDDPGAKLSEPFRPRSYWEFDLDKGTKRLAIRGKLSLGNIDFDGDGNPRHARGFDLANGEFIWYRRDKGKSDWYEIYRLSEDSFENFTIHGEDDSKPGNILVSAQFGDDKIGLWSFNLETRKPEELIYRRTDVDVYGVRYHSNTWAYPDKVTAVRYFTDNLHNEYFDEVEGGMYNQLQQIIPNAHLVSVNSRSVDGATMTIVNSGPKDPGTYYLLRNGEIKSVGSRQPLLESDHLARMDYVTFKARDGETLRAYVTVPNGEAPFPLVVMPHGGPFVSETPVYDEWAQMLANNGYMVVQPQYRGSFNYGLDFHMKSFENGGEGGHKMQDDKDDAALYLVEQGLADPDKLVMFGWSYGGYAALVAASRTPQIYQCTIAGAAVADQGQQVNYYRWQLRGAQKERQMAYRHDSVNPIDEVAKVNVPLLLIHGDVDQRVPVTHANRYRKELDKHGIPYKYVELDGADHFSSTLFYRHQIKLYTSMIDFLSNDCGVSTMQARND